MKKTLIVTILILISSQAVANVYPFRDRRSKIQQWLNANGYGGSVHDGLMQYFSSISDLSQGTLFDHVNNVMDQHGYAGSIDDKLGAFFQEKTGNSDRRDGERSFWSDSGLNFDVGGGFSPGDALLLESGYFLLLESNDKLLLE